MNFVNIVIMGQFGLYLASSMRSVSACFMALYVMCKAAVQVFHVAMSGDISELLEMLYMPLWK